MSDLKTGLMYNELSNKIYWGTVNQKTGIARAGKKDVTSDFIGVMLQKFPIGFKQSIECNGEIEAVVIVVDEEKSHKYGCANEMYELLDEMSSYDECQRFKKQINELLAKARGEK